MENVETDRGGTKRYYKNGKLHRDGDLPAIENRDGEKHYYKTENDIGMVIYLLLNYQME